MQLEWPNVITTNGDGKNDVFKAKGIDDSNSEKFIANLTFINFQVYDRWGVLVFGSQDDVLPNWDGKYQGLAVPSGTYYYIIRYRNTANKNYEVLGYITVLQ
jgi:gliding motility-associated-like protein